MIEVKPNKIKNYIEINVPGSKSYTHRMLIAAALSDGVCVLNNCLKSEDTQLTQNTLMKLGIRINDLGHTTEVYGSKGDFQALADPIYLGNSGTSMRLLTPLVSLGKGTYTLVGSERMHQRPIQDLLESMNQMGIPASSINDNGCPPIEVVGHRIKGGTIQLNCKMSSQYLSALLLVAPFSERMLEIQITEGPVSKPYIDMTVDVMSQFDVRVESDGYDRFTVEGGQVYRSGNYTVEPDSSQAGYFWAAAAVTGSTVKVMGIKSSSRQGDVHFAETLGKMGCVLLKQNDGAAVTGGQLSGIEVDMEDMPDMVPTLAIVAVFAEGTTVIKNVAHLKAKECDRIDAVIKELSKLGVEAEWTNKDLVIKGGWSHGAEIDTYNDHRIAMSFAVAGLKIPGITIRDESCVKKSFPEFWNVFKSMYL
jgi:3-phosphoshikimate 1-carboxyvinyltransferase